MRKKVQESAVFQKKKPYLCTRKAKVMESLRHAYAIAIVDSNILSALGLQQILTDMMPILETRIFVTFSELEAAEHPFAHYFVSSRIYFEHAAFFRAYPHRTIVMVSGDMQIMGVPTLNVCQSEKMIVKSIMALHRQGHPDGHQQAQPGDKAMLLTPREVEVTILLAKGLINKEIADRLTISITTVITHRKNIMEKLHARSVVDIIVYAVMNGLVDPSDL